MPSWHRLLFWKIKDPPFEIKINNLKIKLLWSIKICRKRYKVKLRGLDQFVNKFWKRVKEIGNCRRNIRDWLMRKPLRRLVLKNKGCRYRTMRRLKRWWRKIKLIKFRAFKPALYWYCYVAKTWRDLCPKYWLHQSCRRSESPQTKNSKIGSRIGFC